MKETAHILIVEDDENIRQLIRFNLERSGYKVTAAGTGEKALLLLGAGYFDLILLDLMLPGIDGLSLLRQIRAEETIRDIAVIIITAKNEEEDIIAGLDLGADDYITKPFGIQILIARVRAVLRRKTNIGKKNTDVNKIVRAGKLLIDPAKHKVFLDKEEIELTLTEFGILHYLAGHPGRVFTRYQIVNQVRGDDYAVTERSVDVLVYGLRKKMKQFEDYIETVRGIGYRFKEHDEETEAIL
jgi:DNA-binding response OmpR family regulator